MHVLLTGASGFIGGNVAAILTQAGHQVRPVSRRHGVDVSRMRAPEDWDPLLQGIDAVVNCIGIIGERGAQSFARLHTLVPSALFDACQRAGLRRVIQISALGADATAFTPYHLSKYAADEHLRALDLDWFVLRPSLVYGLGGTSTELFMRLARLPLLPLIGTGQQTLQPLHVSDVAAAVLRCLTAEESRKTLDLVGPETVTFGEWLQRMRQAQRLPRAPQVRVPLTLALALAHLGRHLSPVLSPANLRMLEASRPADVLPLTRLLGRPPRPFAPPLFFADALNAGAPA
jgi:uncharacterized protein YbjT (DUF2867 family)